MCRVRPPSPPPVPPSFAGEVPAAGRRRSRPAAVEEEPVLDSSGGDVVAGVHRRFRAAGVAGSTGGSAATARKAGRRRGTGAAADANARSAPAPAGPPRAGFPGWPARAPRWHGMRAPRWHGESSQRRNRFRPMPAPPWPGRRSRLGYPQYLRTATVSELALVALPGLAGLIVLMFSGGVIGYRQANAGRYLLTERAVRFLR